VAGDGSHPARPAKPPPGAAGRPALGSLVSPLPSRLREGRRWPAHKTPCQNPPPARGRGRGWRVGIPRPNSTTLSKRGPGRSRAARPLLDQFDLLEVELDRSRPAEDRHADLDLVLVEVELLDHAVEAGE